jgi:hypothetical protein
MLRRLFVVLAFLLISLPVGAEGSTRWLVFKVGKDGKIQTRSHEMWCGLKPEPGVNIPVDAVVRLMPSEPKGAKCADFVRTGTSVVYEPEVLTR